MNSARTTGPRSARPGRRPRRWLAWLLFVCFIVIPVLEIYVLIQVGQVIGPWWTVGLLIADSIIGSWIIRREGGRAWNALRSALATGHMPAKELADGALILLGGALMLSPGFVTDVFGIALILPFTRPLFRRVLAALVANRITAFSPLGAAGFGSGPRGAANGPGNARRPGPGQGPVIQGEVVDD